MALLVVDSTRRLLTIGVWLADTPLGAAICR
jgi:hypothetical protein